MDHGGTTAASPKASSVPRALALWPRPVSAAATPWPGYGSRAEAWTPRGADFGIEDDAQLSEPGGHLAASVTAAGPLALEPKAEAECSGRQVNSSDLGQPAPLPASVLPSLRWDSPTAPSGCEQ